MRRRKRNPDLVIALRFARSLELEALRDGRRLRASTIPSGKQYRRKPKHPPLPD